MASGKVQLLRQHADRSSRGTAAGSTSIAVGVRSLSLSAACGHLLGCFSSLLQQRNCQMLCGRKQVQLRRLQYTPPQRWQHQKNQLGHCGWCYCFGGGRTPLQQQQQLSGQQQQPLQTQQQPIRKLQRQLAALAGMLHFCWREGGLIQRGWKGTADKLIKDNTSSLGSKSPWCSSNSRYSSSRSTSSQSRACCSNSNTGRRTRTKRSANVPSSNGIAGRSRRERSNYSSINQNEDYLPHFYSTSSSASVSQTGSIMLSLSPPARQHHRDMRVQQKTSHNLRGSEAGFSSCGAAAAARGTAGPPTGLPIEAVEEKRARQVRDKRDERRRREVALLQQILPRRLRLAFPYVLPAFRPLVLLAGLPVEEQIVSDRSSSLRLAAARRGHALLPPFSPQTEELWCIYTQLMLTDPAVMLLQQVERIQEREKTSEKGIQATAAGGHVFEEGRRSRSAAASFPTATSETSMEQSVNADSAAKAIPDAPAANGDYGDRRTAAAGRKEAAKRGGEARRVRISVPLGELLGQLLATRNVTLQAPWKLLLAAVEPSLQLLQQQQQQQKAKETGISAETESTKTINGASSSSTSTSSSSSSEEDGPTRHFLEVVLRLRTAASRVRHEWKWGVRQIEEAARRDFPVFEKDRALRVLHALSSSKVDDRLCERLADAFVFLWRSDYAEATRMQPTEGLLLLDIFSQRKQLVQALPDPYFFKHICRRLHSYIHLGLLTPWEKTRVSVLYKELKMPHFTFFYHLAAELLRQQQKRQTLIAAGQANGVAALPTADELQQQQRKARRLRLAKLQQQLLLPPAAGSAATVAGATAAIEAAISAAARKAENGSDEEEPRTRAATMDGESIIMTATAAGEKEWKYLEYSRRDYVMGCGVAADFLPSGVTLEQPLLPLLTINTVKRLRRGEFGCHHENSSSSRTPEGEEKKDKEATADDAETFERTDLPQCEGARTTTATATATAVGTSLPGSSAAALQTTATSAAEGICEYTAGQMAVIADAMLFLNMHHETRFADAVIAAVGGRFSSEHMLVHSLDPQQCASVMICFGESKHRLPEDFRLLQLLTNRLVDMTIAEIASPAQCVLFFQALVKWTTRKVIERHERKPQWKQRRNSYISLVWLHAPSPNNRLLRTSDSLTSSESLLLLLCKHICKRVHSMRELTRMLRAIAYLNFSEKLFFRTFSEFCAQRLGEMEEEDIANMTQAFNRAGVEDPYLFSMMGKRYQQLQAKLMAFKHRGVLVRRIG